jgi:hypothetical protein
MKTKIVLRVLFLALFMLPRPKQVVFRTQRTASILAISAATVNLPRPVHVSASLTFLEVADKADHHDYII